MNPIKKFTEWYAVENQKTTAQIPSACCLTSIGLDGYPNSRFVSLKEIIDDKFVITGSLTSRKGIELINNPKAALTFWWPETERQIRVQGEALEIESNLADKYFKARSKDAQLLSVLSKQGSELKSIKYLTNLIDKTKLDYIDKSIERPKEWSGFYIVPKRIEFLEFKKSRFHFRELYSLKCKKWQTVILQP